MADGGLGVAGIGELAGGLGGGGGKGGGAGGGDPFGSAMSGGDPFGTGMSGMGEWGGPPGFSPTAPGGDIAATAAAQNDPTGGVGAQQNIGQGLPEPSVPGGGIGGAQSGPPPGAGDQGSAQGAQPSDTPYMKMGGVRAVPAPGSEMGVPPPGSELSQTAAKAFGVPATQTAPAQPSGQVSDRFGQWTTDANGMTRPSDMPASTGPDQPAPPAPQQPPVESNAAAKGDKLPSGPAPAPVAPDQPAAPAPPSGGGAGSMLPSLGNLIGGIGGIGNVGGGIPTTGAPAAPAAPAAPGPYSGNVAVDDLGRPISPTLDQLSKFGSPTFDQTLQQYDFNPENPSGPQPQQPQQPQPPLEQQSQQPLGQQSGRPSEQQIKDALQDEAQDKGLLPDDEEEQPKPSEAKKPPPEQKPPPAEQKPPPAKRPQVDVSKPAPPAKAARPTARPAAPPAPPRDPYGNTYTTQPGYQGSPTHPLPPYPGPNPQQWPNTYRTSAAAAAANTPAGRAVQNAMNSLPAQPLLALARAAGVPIPPQVAMALGGTPPPVQTAAAPAATPPVTRTSYAPEATAAPAQQAITEATRGGDSPPTRGDPRGMTNYIAQTAQKYGIDPRVALAVARSEGLAQFTSGIRGENSYGAFQLNTQGGLGNQFQRETGLNPADPKNEKATIDYALKHASKNGWGAFHGARNTGIGNWQGINRNMAGPLRAGDENTLDLGRPDRRAPARVWPNPPGSYPELPQDVLPNTYEKIHKAIGSNVEDTVVGPVERGRPSTNIEDDRPFSEQNTVWGDKADFKGRLPSWVDDPNLSDLWDQGKMQSFEPKDIPLLQYLMEQRWKLLNPEMPPR